MNEAVFSIAHLADQGVLILLVVLALVAIILIVQKAVQFLNAHRAFRSLERFNTLLLSHNWNGVAPEALGSTETKELFLAMIEHLKKYGNKGFSEFYEVRKGRVLSRFEASLAFLATVGANAPYIGLFGTVLGIMKAFNDMSQAGAEGSGSVMAGISSALIATAAGLLVAIPSVLAFNYFQKRLKKMAKSLDDTRDLISAYFILEQDRGRQAE